MKIASAMLRSRVAKAIFLTAFLPFYAMSAPVDYVIHISVDGLRGDAVAALRPDDAPNFSRLRTEGAFTDNARTDVGETLTLPNHTTQLTGRGVHGGSGHNYAANVIPSPKTTLHRNKGSYIKSVFDVVHDHGLSTCLYASKEKFVLYEQSYNESNGARDTIGEDNGRKKIDRYLFNEDVAVLVASYLKAMTSTPYNYCMVHLRDPDIAGHGYLWDITRGSAYLESIMKIDDLLGDIFALIDVDQTLNRKTAIILTSDHGGRLQTRTHRPSFNRENYTIPFYVWGSGVHAGSELYELNSTKRGDPGNIRPAYSEPKQPIRNGDSANLALYLLGLGVVPKSTINALQDLRVRLD